MQRIYACELSPEQYIESETHRQVRAETMCPRCGRSGRLHRHGVYERGITGGVGQVLRVLVARFLCLGCGRTVSYLPGFALSYRLVAVTTVEASLDGRHDRRDVQRWSDLLRDYRRRMASFTPRLFRVVGCGLGRAPPGAGGPLWPWLKEACGSLGSAARRLVAEFRISVFGRYQCHQPARP